MNNPCAGIVRSYSSAATALLGLSAAAPAFGASFHMPLDVTLSPYDYAMAGVLVALIVALAVSLVVDAIEVEKPQPQGPDLRWWKNHEA